MCYGNVSFLGKSRACSFLLMLLCLSLVGVRGLLWITKSVCGHRVHLEGGGLCPPFWIFMRWRSRVVGVLTVSVPSPESCPFFPLLVPTCCRQLEVECGCGLVFNEWKKGP